MNVVELIDKSVTLIDPGSSIFRRLEGVPRIDALEAELPRGFPVSFRSLVTRYVFPRFEVESNASEY